MSQLEGLDFDSSKLDVQVGVDMADPKQVEQLAENVKTKYGSLDHVVSSMGGWWQKGK